MAQPVGRPTDAHGGEHDDEGVGDGEQRSAEEGRLGGKSGSNCRGLARVGRLDKASARTTSRAYLHQSASEKNTDDRWRREGERN